MATPPPAEATATPTLTENEQLATINSDYTARYGFHDAEDYPSQATKGTERESVVTTENFPAMRLARWNAASPLPTTGAGEKLRAASRPVSSKQATIVAASPQAPVLSPMRTWPANPHSS